jgi:ribose transport system permease protein
MKQLLSKYGVLVAFIVLFVVSAMWKGDIFLKPESLRNIVNQNVAVGVLAIGMTFVIITGGIDLAVGSLVAFVGAVGLLLMTKLMGGGMAESTAVMVGVICMLGVGVFAGLLQGIVIAYGRVTPFVTTLIGMIAFRSATAAMANGGEIRSPSSNIWPELGIGGIHLPFFKIGPTADLVITWGMIAFFVMVALGSFILNKTRYGRYAIAIGANERASHYSAIPVNRVKILTYALSGFMVGVAAIAQSGKMNSIGSGSTGTFFELDAIAAVVIGGTPLSGGYGRIWGTVIGVLLLGVINVMLGYIGVGSHYQGMVKGAVILIAVLLQRGSRDV